VNSDVVFDGSIPEAYDRYLGPLLFEPFAADLARRLAKPRALKVLEVAAGTGIVTRRLLEVLPANGRLTVTDLNEPMLAHARLKIGEDPRVHWRQADALELPFSDGEFDAVVCQFGLMFFPDKARSIREFYRVLAPGGHLLLSVWDSLQANPHATVAQSAIVEFFSVDPPQFYAIPFSYYDTAEIRKVVAAAGFTNVEIETIKLTGESPSAALAAKGFVRGNPVVNTIRERAPDKLVDIERLAAKRLNERYGPDPIRIPLQAHVVSAVRAT
jgi:ubiquinone/menaquinone biosynthesis C-methylase UbiE